MRLAIHFYIHRRRKIGKEFCIAAADVEEHGEDPHLVIESAGLGYSRNPLHPAGEKKVRVSVQVDAGGLSHLQIFDIGLTPSRSHLAPAKLYGLPVGQNPTHLL